jgi:hypothetical protein
VRKYLLVATLALCGVAAAVGGDCPCGPACGCGPCECGDTSVQRWIASPYVEVRVNPDEPHGSGTVLKIGDETLILTCGHVVADAYKLDPARNQTFRPVHLYKKTGAIEWRTTGRVVFYSAAEEEGGDDLALVKPDAMPYGFAVGQITFRVPAVGEEVWICGTGGGFHQNLDRTICAVNDYELFGKKFVAVQGSVWFGHSGGGVFVKTADGYALCGVITRGHNARNPKTPGLAQHPETIKKFLDKYRNPE